MKFEKITSDSEMVFLDTGLLDPFGDHLFTRENVFQPFMIDSYVENLDNYLALIRKPSVYVTSQIRREIFDFRHKVKRFSEGGGCSKEDRTDLEGLVGQLGQILKECKQSTYGPKNELYPKFFSLFCEMSQRFHLKRKCVSKRRGDESLVVNALFASFEGYKNPTIVSRDGDFYSLLREGVLKAFSGQFMPFVAPFRYSLGDRTCVKGNLEGNPVTYYYAGEDLERKFNTSELPYRLRLTSKGMKISNPIIMSFSRRLESFWKEMYESHNK